MPSSIGNGWKLDKDGLITQHLMNELMWPRCAVVKGVEHISTNL